MKDLYRLKREFLEHCEIERGQSISTIDNYSRYLDRFFNWLEKEKKEKKAETKKDQERNNVKIYPSDINEENVRRYRLYVNRLGGGGGLKVSTQNHHVLALRSFLRYLSSRGVRSMLPERLTLAKAGERKINFLDKEEYKRLVDSINIQKVDGLRDRTILELLFSTGLRVSELCSLNLEDINFNQGEISVLGKGKKVRVVFISEEALEYLAKYLQARSVIKLIIAENENSRERIEIPDVAKKQPLFISNRGNRINPRFVERMVGKYSKKAGITKQVTPHTLRHTFATDLLQAGADIRSVQSLLGHSNITTTQVYTHVTDQHLREIHRKFHNKTEENKKQPKEAI